MHEHRADRRRCCGLREIDPLRVLAGGSNVVLADDLADLTVVLLANTEITVEGNIVRAEAGAVWDDVVVTSLAHGLGGLECPVGHPRIGRRDAGAERRRVRRRGRRHHPPRPAARPPHRRGPLGVAGRSPIRLPHKHSQAFAGRGRARGGVRAGRRRAQRPLRYGELAAALDAEPGPAPTRPGCGRRCCRCGPARAWCSTRPTTTPGASGRSSPTRSSRPPNSTRLKAASDGPVPNYPAPDGVKLAAGWLVERAGFGEGYPGDGRARTVVDQACARADQPRRRHRRGRDRRWPGRYATVLERHSGSNSHPSRF